MGSSKKVKTFLGHPQGLFYLFFAELWERFSFYGMRALLVLYMTKQLLFTDEMSFGVYAAYMSLVYFTPLIGGVLADNYLGYRKSIIIGGLFMAAGHFLLTIETSIFYFGSLALIVVGNGFFKPNISAFVGKLYSLDDIRRDSGFTIFYMGVNIGAAIAPLICAYLAELYGWHYGFMLAGIGMLVGLYFFHRGTKSGVFGNEGMIPDQKTFDEKFLGLNKGQIILVMSIFSVPIFATLIRFYQRVELLKIKNKIKTYKDYRKLLDRKDIDAVIIGTPDHWHCKMMVDALEANKHVFVEKPIANSIEECNIMLSAAKKHGKIIQVGQWQRSGEHYRKAIDIVQSGKLGNIRLVKAWAYQGWCEKIPVMPDAAAPSGVDYQMWLGPAPNRPFNPNRFHFNFRWFWDYAGGLMTDWGVHELDIALFAMGAERPKSVMASGGKFAFPNDAQETPDSLQAVFEFENFNLLWEHATGIDLGPYGRREGMAFIGNNGTLILNRDGYEVVVERVPDGYGNWKEDKMERIEKYARPEGVNYLQVHCENFVAAIKANDSSILNTPIDSGSVAAINAQMGNIAYKTGRKIYWDADKGMFKNDQGANDLIKAHYHNGWKLPIL